MKTTSNEYLLNTLLQPYERCIHWQQDSNKILFLLVPEVGGHSILSRVGNPAAVVRTEMKLVISLSIKALWLS